MFYYVKEKNDELYRLQKQIYLIESILIHFILWVNSEDIDIVNLVSSHQGDANTRKEEKESHNKDASMNDPEMSKTLF